jgi:hypothetical protein
VPHGHGIHQGALELEDPENRELGVGLGRVHNPCVGIDRAERVEERAVVVTDRPLRDDPERRAEAIGELLRVAAVDAKPAARVILEVRPERLNQPDGGGAHGLVPSPEAKPMAGQGGVVTAIAISLM